MAAGIVMEIMEVAHIGTFSFILSRMIAYVNGLLEPSGVCSRHFAGSATQFIN